MLLFSSEIENTDIDSCLLSQLIIQTNMVKILITVYHHAIGNVQGHILRQCRPNNAKTCLTHNDFAKAFDDMEGDEQFSRDLK